VANVPVHDLNQRQARQRAKARPWPGRAPSVGHR
jgi:hypothetical protein